MYKLQRWKCKISNSPYSQCKVTKFWAIWLETNVRYCSHTFILYSKNLVGKYFMSILGITNPHTGWFWRPFAQFEEISISIFWSFDHKGSTRSKNYPTWYFGNWFPIIIVYFQLEIGVSENFALFIIKTYQEKHDVLKTNLLENFLKN